MRFRNKLTEMLDKPLQFGDELGAVVGHRYPEFVYGKQLSSSVDEVPVFCFHETLHRDFEDALSYLRENNYMTITSDDYYGWIRYGKKIPEKAVLLTIDDGLASIWQYGYPLLKKYNLRATVFLIPGYLKNRPRYFYNLDDMWSGRCTGEEILRREMTYYNLLYWEEIIEMHKSGYLDFQSHTLYHHMVYEDGQLVDFFNPDSGRKFFDWPLPSLYERHVIDGTIEDYVGFPIYKSASLYLSTTRFLDNVDLRLAMVEKVKELGGMEFLSSEKASNSTLHRLFKEMQRSKPKGKFCSTGRIIKEIEENLQSSKEIIESKLSKNVNHLCYPYNHYSAVSMEISKKVGYLSSFVGADANKRTNIQGGDPYSTVRLKNDYLDTLPGGNRRSLASVLAKKVKRRLMI